MTRPLKKMLPQTHSGASVSDVMMWVLLAMLPGIAAQTYFFGWGTLLNIFLCGLGCVACEVFALHLRGRDIRTGVMDLSALITAVLLGITLPSGATWWIPLLGSAFAILLGKHAYGGLGQNVFNPAMAGYVFLLLSFPLAMTQWPAPLGTNTIDGTTMATALHVVRENQSLLMADLWQRQPLMGSWGGRGWEWVNIGFLAGGLLLLHRKIFSWHAPLAMLATLAFCSAIFYDNGSSASGGSPTFHLFSGATMVGAFFILTEPVTSPTTTRGRLIAGVLVGALTYLLRHASSYPDGVAFAILLMNFTAPLLDQYTQPRALGHTRKTLRNKVKSDD
ncbi:MAG: RnfABCDGE type electron transport complex subunit D [Spongiibacteraceae bacterium]